MNKTVCYVGVDVGQCELWAAVPGQKARLFAHTPAGVRSLYRWSRGMAGETTVHFCMEATGVYSRRLAVRLLAAANTQVSIINPAQIKALAQYLRETLNLTLSMEKTRVTALSEGFSFLGHRVRLRWDERWGWWPRIEIPKAKVNDFRHRIKQMTNRGHTHHSFQTVIDALNPVLLGWGRFYQHGYGAKAVFTRIDHYVWDRLRRWLCKKYPKTPRLEIRRRY